MRNQHIITPNIPDKQLSVRNYVRPRINRETGNYEKHLPLASWIGPQSDVVRRLDEGVKPTTKVDRGAMRHDIDYYNIRSGLRKKAIAIPRAKQLARQSDNRLINTAKSNLISFNPVNSAHAAATLAGMKTKTIAEDIGKLDRLKFVGAGRVKDPLRKMRAAMINKN